MNDPLPYPGRVMRLCPACPPLTWAGVVTVLAPGAPGCWWVERAGGLVVEVGEDELEPITDAARRAA